MAPRQLLLPAVIPQFKLLILLSVWHSSKALVLSQQQLLHGSRYQVSAQASRRLFKDSSSPAVDDEFSKLVSAPATNYGNYSKYGMLPIPIWSPDHVKLYDFEMWLLNGTILGMPVSKAPPLTFKCGIWVNHYYKIIFIRTRKAASTSIVWAMGGVCGERGSKTPKCFEVMAMKQFENYKTTAEDAWKEYFVFGVARNPWARAASGYDYLAISKRRSSTGPCTVPNFEQFSKDPMVFGKQAALFSCSKEAPDFNYFHVEPSARCFKDKDGLPVVDFVIRYEHLEEDFATALAIINLRRKPSLDPMPVKELAWRNKGAALKSSQEADDGSSSAQHAAKYRECGKTCVEQLADFFKEDMELFGFTNSMA